MRILVCNDDGIYSPGIAALADVAGMFGTVRIVAPNVEQSSMGHAITASRPLSFRATRLAGPEAYRVNGPPADCVSLGAFKWGEVDLVLSGCNLGFNLGNSIWHSGTLAGAKQAALLGLRGIAFSVKVSGPSRAYVCENHGAAFRLPELGPIGSNGLANPRDFLAPAAACEATLVRLKAGARLVLTGPRSEADPTTVTITWFGYGQFLREERAPRRDAVAWAYAMDDVALRAMLGARELRPGQPIESVTISQEPSRQV